MFKSKILAIVCTLIISAAAPATAGSLSMTIMGDQGTAIHAGTIDFFPQASPANWVSETYVNEMAISVMDMKAEMGIAPAAWDYTTLNGDNANVKNITLMDWDATAKRSSVSVSSYIQNAVMYGDQNTQLFQAQLDPAALAALFGKKLPKLMY